MKFVMTTPASGDFAVCKDNTQMSLFINKKLDNDNLHLVTQITLITVVGEKNEKNMFK
jgi:hypothetical protein